MKKCLVADKECQITIVNYRKGGSAFNNLVSVIPVPGGVSNLPEEADQVAYHIGFQVDLADQPNAILQRLRSGTCAINYNHSQLVRSPNPITTVQKERRINSASSVVPVSKNLRSLLGDDGFVKSIPISTSTTLNHAFVSSSSGDKGSNADAYDGNQFLSMLLLESGPDFVHVLSLRGAFLYVAPSIRRVLGYDPEEVVGKSVSDYCHPADLVPLMRELKESSATLSPENRGGFSTQLLPKKVDLLFRIMSKSDGYVWVESRGRLHVEPGKGRKAIILSGRTRGMPRLTWGPVAHAGGLVTPSVGGADEEANEREFWGVLNQIGTFLSVGGAVRDVLGWSVDEVIGKRLEDFIDTSTMGRDANFNPLRVINDAIQLASSGSKPEYTQVSFDMRKKDGNKLHVIMIVYHSTVPSTHPPEPVICQIKMATPTIHAPIVYPTTSDVFEELDTKRNTSWQYELQQLKFANERLLEEVQTLELRSKRNQPHHQTSHATFPPLPAHKTTDDWAPTYEGLQIEHTRHWEAGLI
jgi:PAS domain-containing protein